MFVVPGLYSRKNRESKISRAGERVADAYINWNVPAPFNRGVTSYLNQSAWEGYTPQRRGNNYRRRNRWSNYGMSSFSSNRGQYYMPYRRRYRRRGRRFGRFRRRNGRFNRRRRFNKTRRRYQRMNWRKGAFQGVGAQCMPTHAFCKIKRKFAGLIEFVPDTSAFLLFLRVVTHDLSIEADGLHNASTQDMFSTESPNSVLFTTPHAINFLKDSFNLVRCAKIGINVTVTVVPDTDANEKGHNPLVFSLIGEDSDAASTDKINVNTTNVAELLLDKYALVRRHMPWYNNSGATGFEEGFTAPNRIKFKKFFDMPTLIENTNRKHYWDDDDYANKISGSLGSRSVATPAATGEVTCSLMVAKGANSTWNASEYVSIQVMGTVTQYTTWSKPNANLRFQD